MDIRNWKKVIVQKSVKLVLRNTVYVTKAPAIAILAHWAISRNQLPNSSNHTPTLGQHFERGFGWISLSKKNEKVSVLIL